MTNEEKIRAYDEALERARQLNADNMLSDEAIEEIFPQLAESEDERIIEGFYTLIRGIRRDGGLTLNKVPLDKCETWLKKQKENPKSVDSIPPDCASNAKCEDRDSNYGVFPEDVIVVARACEKLETHGYPELAYALKNVNLYTKEQKPNIELIQRSWYMEGYHDREFNMEPKWVVKAEKGGPRYYENPNYGKPLEQKEQKPAEYSNEEEYLDSELRAFLCNYDKEYDDDPAVSDVAKHFYELGKRRLQQEWSEEDEKMLSRIIERGQSQIQMFETGLLPEHISWLKSLRPSWKPSEEQKPAYKVGDKISWKGKEYTIDKVVCGDDRFEIIGRAKQAILEETNIADSPEEMAELDNILFRCWQMGWLKKYETQ